MKEGSATGKGGAGAKSNKIARSEVKSDCGELRSSMMPSYHGYNVPLKYISYQESSSVSAAAPEDSGRAFHIPTLPGVDIGPRACSRWLALQPSGRFHNIEDGARK